jgi:ribose-phosphate pyrophosphokinase
MVVDASKRAASPAIRRTVGTGLGVRRFVRPKVQGFKNDEVSIRLTRSPQGRDVHVLQTAERGGEASALFRTLQTVEALHMNRAESVRVLLDDGIARRLGHGFVSDLLASVGVESVQYVGESPKTVKLAGRAGNHGRSAPSAASGSPREPLLWGGNSHPELLASLGQRLERRADTVTVDWSGSGAPVTLPENPRGRDIVFVQSKRLSDPESFHRDMIEMLRVAWEAKRQGAGKITLVSPYLPYSRSDRMDAPGISVGAALLPQLMQRVGFHQVVFYSVHQPQVVGTFQALRMRAVHASGESILARRAASEFRQRGISASDIVVMAPDAGAEKRARVFADFLAKELGIAELPIVTANKERHGTDIKLRFNADVRGKTTVAIDDETASGGTLNDLAQAARGQGAESVYAAVSHLAGPAHQKIDPKLIRHLFVLDTLPQQAVRESGHPAIEVVGIAEHLSKILKGLETGAPIDEHLFFEHR